MVLPDLVLLRCPRRQWCLTHVGDVCTLKTSGTIQHDKSVKFKAVMNRVTAQLVISNLHFKYNICVDPKHVSFGVHPTNDFGFCDTDTSLSSAVSASWTEKAITNGKRTTDLTLKIDADNLNANKLGKAYSQTNGESSISLCVRARVKKGDVRFCLQSTISKSRFQ